MSAYVADELAAPPYFVISGNMEKEIALLALAALSQGTRLDTFKLLVRHEPDGVAAGDIARELAVPANTMSAHLAVLARAGLVAAQRHSRSIIYRASLDRLRDLTLYLVKDCCGGRSELCAPLIAELVPCYPPPKKAKALTK